MEPSPLGAEGGGTRRLQCFGAPWVPVSAGTLRNVKGLFASSGREAPAEGRRAKCSRVPSGAEGP